MFMFGYQNEGFKKYNFGESPDAKWMFSASQMFPYPGKLALKGEMVSGDADALRAALQAVRVKTVSRVKELYYELFLAHRNIDIVKERTKLFAAVEEAALARYASGMGSQQEALMAQTEKYMLLEKEEMLRQKVQSTEAMLNSVIGRDANTAINVPSVPAASEQPMTLEALQAKAFDHSPEIGAKEKMVLVAKAKVAMARKEYYPDFTITGGYEKRRGEFADMWSLTTTITIPIFYKTKQRQAVLEAEALLAEAEHEVEAAKLMVGAVLRDNYSMAKSATRLMQLYQTGLIPKTLQDFELGLSAYRTGKTEAMVLLTKLKNLLDYEMLYWTQFVEREKAMARLHAAAGTPGAEEGGQHQ
jgi:outer membrane protein TolC